ncbi:lipocalin family protein [Emticicia sp. 21SJ11W-3]|uniref:lipocalin family protein n=1 Tax=Emticicia sp. 21SJ11W-3 TaxID=2916755 RepID=UPI00209E733E|nr:lipocalin family protein [Emticicia sp. 21SJ11W-3]UTA67884.1 lipocalin family protein [Emticicia sp. 21SJ11W-3]
MNISVFRRVAVLLVLATVLFAVTNCSKKDEPTGQSTGIEGRWKFTAVYTKSGNAAEVDNFGLIVADYPCFAKIEITFKSDGFISANVPTECKAVVNDFVGNVDGKKYEVKNGKITILDGSTVILNMDVTFKGNQMDWLETTTSGGTSSSTRLVLTKQ